MAEVVKTGLLAGHELWKLPEDGDDPRLRRVQGRRLSSRDPHETEGRRAILNLGHTFAHALEAAAGYAGLATARPSRSACSPRSASRASRPTPVEEILRPEPVEADLDARLGGARARQEGARASTSSCESAGRPVVTTVPDGEARAALAALIAQ